jgi:hypothetical protein
VLNALLMDINRKLGTALYMSTPSMVGLIGISVGPRLSRTRLKLTWNEFKVVGSERVSVADGGRLRALEVARRRSGEQVSAIESRRIAVIVEQVPAV